MQICISERTLHECAFISYTNAIDELLDDFEIQIPHKISRSIFPRNSQWMGWFIEADGTVKVTG